LTNNGGRLGAVIGNVMTGFHWDHSHCKVTKINSNGNRTHYSYAPMYRVTKVISANGTQKTYAYDINHNLIGLADPNQTERTYGYDRNDRPQTLAITAGVGVSQDTSFAAYAYDGLSRLVFVEDNDSQLQFGYDSLSNIISETQNGLTVTRGYDGNRNLTGMAYPSGRQLTMTYDRINRTA
jgi:YD repeat-containing protein